MDIRVAREVEISNAIIVASLAIFQRGALYQKCAVFVVVSRICLSAVRRKAKARVAKVGAPIASSQGQARTAAKAPMRMNH